MKDNVAIVIPAYKIRYLKEAIDSILNQIDDGFHIYIGDDASPENIKSIVDLYHDIPNITYHRFDNNMGQNSLANHWNRCIDIVKDESWIWLFSDDDIMESNCIEKFRECLKRNKDVRLFKFNSIKFMDGNVLKRNIFPPTITTLDLLNIKLNYTSESYVIDYIFHKSVLDKVKFPDFPLAWCTDDLFWITISRDTTICTIPDAFVYWRYSNHNISGKINTAQSSIQKMKACYLFAISLSNIGIFPLNREVKFWLFSWYIKQYNYLKAPLSFFGRSICLLRIYRIFPITGLKYINKNK